MKKRLKIDKEIQGGLFRRKKQIILSESLLTGGFFLWYKESAV